MIKHVRITCFASSFSGWLDEKNIYPQKTAFIEKLCKRYNIRVVLLNAGK